MSEKLLLDSNIVIALANETTGTLSAHHQGAIENSGNRLTVSVASLWEIAIKFRLGKLALLVEPEHIPALLAANAIGLQAVGVQHALALVAPMPDTKDPFDRILLAICQVEGMKLVTTDGKLSNHPLAY
ncbi:MAG: hypothetical protein RL367_2368 [Pseudomonadota bacterium]